MTSPISLPVLALLLLALTLAYCAGAYAVGLWIAVCLVGSGIIGCIAIFIEASEAYSSAVMECTEDEL